MAGNMNRVYLLGNVGKKPEFKRFQSGDSYAVFSMATNKVWKDKTSGEKKQQTEWHRVVVFPKGLVSLVEQYVGQGTKIMVVGELNTRKWTDPQGIERWSTEIAVRPYGGEIILLGGTGGGRAEAPPPPPDPISTASEPAQTTEQVLDDSVPF